MQTSKSVQPSLIFLARSSSPTSSAPAALASLGQVALGEHDDALRLADAVRQHDRAADELVGLLGIDAQPHRDLDRLVELRVVELLEQRRRPRSSGSGSSLRMLFGQSLAFVWIALAS